MDSQGVLMALRYTMTDLWHQPSINLEFGMAKLPMSSFVHRHFAWRKCSTVLYRSVISGTEERTDGKQLKLTLDCEISLFQSLKKYDQT
jgi:hypothetical protein